MSMQTKNICFERGCLLPDRVKEWNVRLFWAIPRRFLFDFPEGAIWGVV